MRTHSSPTSSSAWTVALPMWPSPPVIKITAISYPFLVLIISSADDQHSGTLAGMSASAKTGSQAGRRLGYLFKHAGLLMSELNDAVLAPFGIEPRELGILIV